MVIVNQEKLIIEITHPAPQEQLEAYRRSIVNNIKMQTLMVDKPNDMTDNNYYLLDLLGEMM